MGAEIAWVQMLLTWAQGEPSGALQTFADSPDDQQVDRLTDRMIGTVASLCAGRVVSKSSGKDLTDAYRAKALDRLNALQDRRPNQATKGPSIEVITGDDYGRDKPASFYPRTRDGSRLLGSRDYFMRAAPRMLGAISRQVSWLEQDELSQRTFGTLLYEAFRNTEDHARRDLDGNIVNHSYRLVQASFAGQLPEALDRATAGYAPLRKYIRRFSPKAGHKQLSFVTLSILDSGPGFAQTWTQKPLQQLSDEEEYAATLDCFTAGTRKAHDVYGRGLVLVREFLRKSNGFLRLRTGRMSLFYDAHADVSPDGPIPVERWRPESGTQLAPVSGALLTMMFPVRGTH
ncbi:hypothetical protein [Henriciella algicola]|nr:hypothetical protein [Henriciella algicola]